MRAPEITTPEMSSPIELGYLVARRHDEQEGHSYADYSGVVAKAKKELFIPADPEMDGMVGQTYISLDGKLAAVGWLAPSGPADTPHTTTPEIKVDNHEGEKLIVVEGSLGAMIRCLKSNKNNQDRTVPQIKADGNKPDSINLDYGDRMNLVYPLKFDKSGKLLEEQEQCWFLRIYS